MVTIKVLVMAIVTRHVDDVDDDDDDDHGTDDKQGSTEKIVSIIANTYIGTEQPIECLDDPTIEHN